MARFHNVVPRRGKCDNCKKAKTVTQVLPDVWYCNDCVDHSGDANKWPIPDETFGRRNRHRQ